MRVKGESLNALKRLQISEDARVREQAYLEHFALDETYKQWERFYVPLAGLLQPPSRLFDKNDPGIGAAGESLPDVREALTKRDKR